MRLPHKPVHFDTNTSTRTDYDRFLQRRSGLGSSSSHSILTVPGLGANGDTPDITLAWIAVFISMARSRFNSFRSKLVAYEQRRLETDRSSRTGRGLG